ncbi:hypothetical protein F4677DRAFT_363665 [Hypoxylon crocopeplum]|nr:hypothetical protein F4677DRAFT_363665 [Hypoxylon crocopeplum]
MDKTQVKKHCIAATIIAATICCLAVALQALHGKDYVKSGVATLQFDFNATLLHALGNKRAPQPFKVIGPLLTAAGSIPDALTQIQSVAGPIATQVQSAAGGLVTEVKSAAGAVATSVPSSLGAILPRNCSLGTRQFCVAVGEHVSCSDLPLKLSSIIPSEVAQLGHDFSVIEALDPSLSKIATPYIYDMLILGLVLICPMAFCFVFCLYRRSPFLVGSTSQRKAFRVALYLVLGLAFCIPFVLPVAVLRVLRSQIVQRPSWIQVQESNLYGLCVGCLICAVATVLVVSSAPAIC